MYFSLRTGTKEETENTKNIIKELKKFFGEDKIRVTDYECWISVSINDDNARGFVDLNNLFGKNKFYIYKDAGSDNKFEIPVEALETVFC